jgi:hypothetical protein
MPGPGRASDGTRIPFLLPNASPPAARPPEPRREAGEQSSAFQTGWRSQTREGSLSATASAAGLWLTLILYRQTIRSGDFPAPAGQRQLGKCQPEKRLSSFQCRDGLAAPVGLKTQRLCVTLPHEKTSVDACCGPCHNNTLRTISRLVSLAPCDFRVSLLTARTGTPTKDCLRVIARKELISYLEND